MSRAALGTILSLVFLASFTACRKAESSPGHGKRVIILGIDAMDPAFLERHWDALPNLDRLRSAGTFTRIATTVPPQSPVAWSSFITGMDPGGHGIYDFVHRDPATLAPFSSMGEIEPSRRTLAIGPYLIPLSQGRVRTFLQGRAFWQILSDRDVPVTLVRMPNNFPPSECEGRALSGMGTPDLQGTFGTFTFFTDSGEAERQVSGGRIVPVTLTGDRATLLIDGPENTLRKDRRRGRLILSVARDPVNSVAVFETDETRFILRQGEWSGWIRVRFTLIPGLSSAAGMIRVYAKKLQPDFQVYVSPVNIDPADPALPISQPESYSRELAESIGPFYTQGIAEDTAALREGALTFAQYREQSRLVAREHFALLHRALDDLESGLLFFHFLGVDQDSHVMWGKQEEALLDTYKLVDTEIGRVMAKAGDATVAVVSDHGFSTFDRAVHLNTWLWREGFMELDDPANTGDTEMFPHTDWSRTQAYALGLNAIYLNLAGRERDGIVQPGAESHAVLERLARRLEDFRDPKTGRRVVETVYRTETAYSCAPQPAAPDLIVGYAAGYRSSWQSALGAVPNNTLEDNTDEWGGDHCIAAHLVPGALLSNRKASRTNLRLEDLTVTALAEFGARPDKGMIGRPIF